MDLKLNDVVSKEVKKTVKQPKYTSNLENKVPDKTVLIQINNTDKRNL